MNFVLLMGRFVADPELKKTTRDEPDYDKLMNGKSVCAFTLAVDKGKDRGADFIDTVAWEKTAEFICKYFKKGDPIIIDGAINTRTYEDKDGKKRKVTEVTAKNVEFAPRARTAQQESGYFASADVLSADENEALQSRTVAQGTAEEFELVEDEDLPF